MAKNFYNYKAKGSSTSTYISGSDLCKFYARPLDVKQKPNDIIEDELVIEDLIIPFSVYEEKIPFRKQFASTGTQTDYRESEAQTDPWDPSYIIRKVYQDPEVLSIKDLYGNGLPATHLEVEHILKKRKNRRAELTADSTSSDEKFEKNKQNIYNEVLTDWNYKISRHTEKQMNKLKEMELALAEELIKHSEKQERLLKNIWTQKKSHMNKVNSKLQKNLRKEIKVLEKKSKVEEEKFDVKAREIKEIDKEFAAGDKIKDPINDEIDFLLSKYYMNPKGLKKIIDWLERRKRDLFNEVPVSKPVRRSKREKLTEIAYQEFISKKQTKMPPKLYREDYDEEESSASSVKGEIEFEILELPEEGVDLVTVWQQVLRGRAYQKQMLELIEKHKDVLETLLY